MKHTATEAFNDNIDLAEKAIAALLENIAKLKAEQPKEPRHWGYAGTAEAIRHDIQQINDRFSW